MRLEIALNLGCEASTATKETRRNKDNQIVVVSRNSSEKGFAQMARMLVLTEHLE